MEKKRFDFSKLIGFNIYTIALILIVFLGGIGLTYAYYAFSYEEESVIAGNVINVDLDLEVDLVVGTNEEMVPLNNAALSNALNAVGSTNGACVDSVGNLSCQVYKITLINKGSRVKHLKGSIELYAKGGIGNVYNNLKWREITNPTTIKSDAVINGMSESVLVSDLTMESKETKVWYIAVWISEVDSDQRETDKGVFGGTVKFEVGGDNSLPLNEYGFYYDKKYSMETEEGKMSLAFYEDGSVGLYLGGFLVQTMPADSAVYEEGVIIFDGMNGYISSDGTIIDFSDGNMTLVLDDDGGDYSIYTTDIKVEEFYNIYIYGNLDGSYMLKLKFYENNTAELYFEDILYQTIPVSYGDNSVFLTEIMSFGSCYFDVSHDGELIGGICENDTTIDSFLGVEKGHSISFILGDEIIVEGDYSYYWEGNGWGVFVNDKSKSYYGAIRTELNGFPIINLGQTFQYCTNLVSAPVLPSSVKYMNNTFDSCTSLVNAPVLPSNVITMYQTFSYCSSLVNAPVIPNSVINMSSTFSECTSLEGNVEINANPSTVLYAFSGTEKPIVITGTSSNETKAALAATATNGNVTY